MSSLAILMLLLILFSDHQIVDKISAGRVDRLFSFGLADGFYDEDIILNLSVRGHSMHSVDIYYTTDGSCPTQESERYKKPILFPATDALTVATVQASVYMDGDCVGGPYHATYFLSKNKEAFQNIMLVSITAEKEDLFGAETGILYPAVSYVTTGEGERWNQLHAENFAQKGEEWVRQAHVAAFEGTGEMVFSQGCGLSVSGNHGSIIHYPFSLKIKADYIYDDQQNVFAYDPFDREVQKGTKQSYYNKLAFKNGGNDYAWNGLRDDINGTMLKNTVGTRMARELGLAASPSRIAIVFLNGEFYNLTYLITNPTSKALAVYTDLDAHEITIEKSTERNCFDGFEIEGLYISFPDMSDSDIFEERDTFESMVDMRDLFRYYAFEMIVGNSDWPHNNFAMWHYTGKQQNGNIYSDGKLRFWVFDLDCMYDTQYWMTDPWEAVFTKTRKENCLLPILMQIEDYKIAFVNTVLDELNDPVFQEEYIYQIIEEEDAAFRPWYTWLYGETAEQSRQDGIEIFRQNVSARRSEVMEYLNQYFEIGALYTLEILPSDNAGSFLLNSMLLEGKGFIGTYSQEYPVSLSYEDNGRDALECWIVNGEKVKSSTLTVTADMIKGGKVTIQPIMK